MQTFFRVCNILLGIANLAAAIFWFSLIKIEVAKTGSATDTHVLDHLALQISVLESLFGFGGIVMAVLGIFGYQLVIERAEIKADKAAREVVAALHEDGKLSGQPSRSSLPQQEDSLKATNVDTSRAEEESA